VFVDGVVDMADSRAHKESKDEGNNVMTMCPHADVDGIEHRKKREAPADAVDDKILACVGKLIEDETKEEEVNEGPDEEGPGGWSEIGVFSRAVHILGPGVSEQSTFVKCGK